MRLIEPKVELKEQYLDMLKDWKEAKEPLIPFCISFDASNFKKLVKRLLNYKKKPEKGFVKHSTFLLINSKNNIIGVSNIRHKLTEKLKIEGGHIGFGIRPSYRKKGFAKKILELSLLEAKKLGIKEVLVTCDKDNIGSAKTIIINGGVLEKEHLYEGVLKQNYWIINY